ncbi:MAG: TetR family transcriptional regulator [Micropepsaceae bacterium]
MSKKPNSRQAILDAAESLAAEIGANHMSLDAVAALAGISKGGLLYQFPSKVALLQGMLERYVERLEAPQKQSRTAKSKSSEASRLLAARLAARGKEDVAKQRRGSFGMIAAIAERPLLLDPVRKAHSRIWDRLCITSKDPELALLTWFALEGLLFVELFGTSPLKKGERSKFLKRLQKIAVQSS